MKTLDTPHCNDDVALSERFNYNDDEMRSDRARLVLTFTSVLDPFLSPPLQPSVTPYEWMWLNRNEADGERLNQAMTVCCIILRLFEYQKRFFFFTIYSFLPLHSQQTYIRSHPKATTMAMASSKRTLRIKGLICFESFPPCSNFWENYSHRDHSGSCAVRVYVCVCV